MSPTESPSSSLADTSLNNNSEIDVGVGGGYVSLITIASVFITLILLATWAGQRRKKKQNQSNNNDDNDDNDDDNSNNLNIDEVVIQIDQFIEERNNSMHRDNNNDNIYNSHDNDASTITMDNYLKRIPDYTHTDEEKGMDKDKKDDSNRQESGNTWYSPMISSVSSLFNTSARPTNDSSL